MCHTPRSPGAGTGGLTAKDALGNDVTQTEWLKTHKKGDRSLTQGLKVGAVQLRKCENSCSVGFKHMRSRQERV